MITVTPCSTHYSNQLLTHSLTIGKKIESPRRSLRSLWGLIKEIKSDPTFHSGEPPKKKEKVAVEEMDVPDKVFGGLKKPTAD